MKRLALVAILAVGTVGGCSSGPAAPDPEPTRSVCTDTYCIDVPPGWSGEVGDTFIAFNHEALPEGTFLTSNTVDMEAIVSAAGGTWPVPTNEVVEAFWSLLEDVDEGGLVRTERMVGGAWRSWGTHSTGTMWYFLMPLDGSRAIGVELRGPNDSWESHADVVFASVENVG